MAARKGLEIILQANQKISRLTRRRIIECQQKDNKDRDEETHIYGFLFFFSRFFREIYSLEN